MGHLSLTGPDRKLIRNQLMSAYDVYTLGPLVKNVSLDVHSEVPWFHPSGEKATFSKLEDTANMHGVLDRLLAAVAADRPFRPDLRALAIHFTRDPGWAAPLEGHGMDLAEGLERLTSPGNPFVDTTRLARWLIRAERQVCQVRCGNEHGTGFLVAPDLVLTCHHVVKNHVEGNVTPADVKVRFDYRRDARGKEPPYGEGPWLDIDAGWQIPFSRYSPADIDLQGDPAPDELDYAVLKLTQEAGNESPEGETAPRGWVDVSADPALPAAESPILIVQHPGREAKPPPQMPLQITFATPGFEGPNANGTRVKYKPSTQPGSSGSPVYGRELRAVALHHNRGQINPNAVELTLNNRGIPLAKIRAHLPDAVRQALVPPPAA